MHAYMPAQQMITDCRYVVMQTTSSGLHALTNYSCPQQFRICLSTDVENLADKPTLPPPPYLDIAFMPNPYQS